MDVNNSDFEDNYDTNKKAGDSLEFIKKGAIGQDTKSSFTNALTSRIAQKTSRGSSNAIDIDNFDDSDDSDDSDYTDEYVDIEDSESEVDSIKQDEVIPKIEETVEETVEESDQEIYDRLVKLQPYSSTVYARSKYKNPEYKEKYPKTYQYVMKYKNADDLVLNQSMADYSRYNDSDSDSTSD